MTLLPDFPRCETALRLFMGVFSIILFFAAVTVLALLIRQKRYKLLWLGVPLLCLSYFTEQCFDMYFSGSTYSQTAAAIRAWFSFLPDWLLLSFLAAFTAIAVWLLRNIHHHEKVQITTMSVKEATDSLPIGICWYVPGGIVLLANHAMEAFCEKATGGLLQSGEELWEQLLTGKLQDGCQTLIIGGDVVTILPDGTAWNLRNETVPYEKHSVCMLLALDVTETYRKTLDLQKKQEKLKALGKRLDKVNQEIVALTTEREILNARVQMHDELGNNLLSIKRFMLHGGTQEERAVLMESLGHNLSFLKNDRPSPVRDEYELMIETAARLGVSVSVTGELPQTEPHKHILATAIHECFTNALRHAHGDELRICITQEDAYILAVFENNGQQPTGEIHEKGGLFSLRALTERAGGHMNIRISPSFAIVLELPKEAGYVI